MDELHARPFHAMQAPFRVLHFAFMTSTNQASADRDALARLCVEEEIAPPPLGAKYHRMAFPHAHLRWEQHSEFTTYSWEFGQKVTPGFAANSWPASMIWKRVKQLGPYLTSIDLTVLPRDAEGSLTRGFLQTSLAASLLEGGSALVATDFVSQEDGFVRIAVVNKGLTTTLLGALVQRLIEIETYRALALLGLPEAYKFTQQVRAIEESLATISRTMVDTNGLSADRDLLEKLTALAANLEADSACAGFRFRATQAYDEIVQQRLEVIGEKQWKSHPTIGAFLSRRMAPAMRTCQMLEHRRLELARQLTRVTNLLRARVDVEIEQQNRDLLKSMNERTRLQLKLQQTVEIFSVAAVSYYVVGLLAHVFAGLKLLGALSIDPDIATAISVPFLIVLIGAAVLGFHRMSLRVQS